jgi:hypothetical protein
VYTTEAASLVRQLTGADEVVSLGWMLRRSATERRGALPPAPDDTDHSVAWRAPYTAFRDAAAPEAHPRESVELRTVAFFY